MGGGGIRPDLFVAPDTFTTPERAFVKGLGNKIPTYWDVRTAYALEIKTSGRVKSPDFTVTPDMADEVIRRLRARSIALPDSVVAGARNVITQDLGYEIARYVFGRPAEVRRQREEDRQVRAALGLARRAKSPQDLLALGALHPLQTISNPEHAAERLKGAWAAVEGMPGAVQAAEALAHDLGLRPFHISSKAKPMYHASAVFASNYFVVVEAVAQRLLRHAGLSDTEAWEALRPLVEGTLENLIRQQPVAALTGPVARGDVATIRRQLEALTHDDAVLYRAQRLP